MHDVTNMILWLDLETTGNLDSPVEDNIVEFAARLTYDDDGFTDVPGATVDTLVQAPTEAYEWHHEAIEMHRASGLLADLTAAHKNGVLLPTLTELDAYVTMMVRDHAAGRAVAMGGSGIIKFDWPRVRYHLPNLADTLTYWSLDVGVMRRFGQRSDVEIKAATGEPKHRAMADVDSSLHQARVWQDFLSRMAAVHIEYGGDHDGDKALIS